MYLAPFRNAILYSGPTAIDPLTGLGSGLADITPPAAPAESVSKNAAGYVYGNTPLLAGIAQAGATIKVYSGATRIGSYAVRAFNVDALAPIPPT